MLESTPEPCAGSLKQGALLLADLGYFGFHWFDELTEQGYSWISRVKGNTTIAVLHTYYEVGETFDRLVWLGARDTLGKYAVRQVQFRKARGATAVLHQRLRSNRSATDGDCSAVCSPMGYRIGVLDFETGVGIASDLE